MYTAAALCSIGHARTLNRTNNLTLWNVLAFLLLERRLSVSDSDESDDKGIRNGYFCLVNLLHLPPLTAFRCNERSFAKSKYTVALAGNPYELEKFTAYTSKYKALIPGGML